MRPMPGIVGEIRGQEGGWGSSALELLTCASACDDGYEAVDIEDVAC